jgi:hypothetical protein
VLRTTLIALLVATVVLGMSALRLRTPAGGVALAASLLVFAVVANQQALRTLDPDYLNRFTASAVVAGVRDSGPAPGQAIGIRWDSPGIGWHETMERWMVYQFYLPGQPIVGLGDRRLPDAGMPGYVFASRDDPNLQGSGAEVVWSHPNEPFVLWRQPG